MTAHPMRMGRRMAARSISANAIPATRNSGAKTTPMTIMEPDSGLELQVIMPMTAIAPVNANKAKDMIVSNETEFDNSDATADVTVAMVFLDVFISIASVFIILVPIIISIFFGAALIALLAFIQINVSNPAAAFLIGCFVFAIFPCYVVMANKAMRKCLGDEQ